MHGLRFGFTRAVTEAGIYEDAPACTYHGINQRYEYVCCGKSGSGSECDYAKHGTKKGKGYGNGKIQSDLAAAQKFSVHRSGLAYPETFAFDGKRTVACTAQSDEEAYKTRHCTGDGQKIMLQ